MIVEFADFACPHCAAAFPIVREIAAKHPDRVRFVFRNFPVITEHSLTLALAGFCANEQGKFWLLHDKIFLKQGIATEAELAELARAGGLDATKFAACLSAQKYLSAVQKDFEDGQSLGVTGTPTWFFNGTRVEGDIPRETFLMIIEELIK